MRSARLFTLRFFPLVFICLFVGLSCLKSQQPAPPTPFTLTLWSTQDTPADFESVINAYKQVYPYVTIEVKTWPEAEYEQALFDAWAKGEGPDLFVISNDRIGRFASVIEPMPASVKFKKVETGKKNFFGQTQNTIVEETVEQLTTAQLPSLFVDAVVGAAVRRDKIYALPLSIDTLALYYNRDLLAQARVAIAPASWDDFLVTVSAMVGYADSSDATGKQIVRAAAALGTADNVPHVFDIISVLMLQNGVVLTNPDGEFVLGSRDQLPTAARALDFYRKFADPEFTSYTWNVDQSDALDAFSQGSLGMYIGYHRDERTLIQRATTVKYDVSNLPQIDPSNPINYAQLQMIAVYVQSPHTDHAWNFARIATSNPDFVSKYSDATDTVSPLRAVLAKQQKILPDKCLPIKR